MTSSRRQPGHRARSPWAARRCSAQVIVITDDIMRRIDQASRYVPLERLCLSPQCGFASTVQGNQITEADQWAKLERIVAVTQQVWGAVTV